MFLLTKDIENSIIVIASYKRRRTRIETNFFEKLLPFGFVYDIINEYGPLAQLVRASGS